MKKFFKSLALVAVAAASLFSCQKPNPVEPDQNEYTYTFTLSNSDTKAYLATEGGDTFTKWESGDQLGVYTVGTLGTSYNRYGNINSSETPVKFQISSYYALGAGDRVYCYFPYDENNKNGDAQNPAKVNLSIPTQQNGKMNAMPMVSVPYTMTSSVDAQTDKPIADINMRNLGGVFQFRVYSSEAAYRTETVKSVEFSDATGISGSFVFNITQNANLDINGNTGSSIIVNQNAAIGADSEHGGIVNMVVKPGSYTGTLVVKTDAASYSFDITSAKTVERSHIKPLNVNLANGTRTAATIATLGGWTSKPISGSNSLNVNGTLKDDMNHSWSVALTGSEASKNPSQSVYTGSTYWQIGANGNMATAVFSSNAISGTITSIAVDCAAYSGMGSVNVTVGGESFGTQNQTMPTWASNSSNKGGVLSFTGSASGDIVVTLAATTGGRAIYLSSIKVTYLQSGGSSPDPVTAPTFDVAAGTYTEDQLVLIDNYDENYLYAYTLDGTDPAFDAELNVTNGTEYDNDKGINITSSCTLKAIAIDEKGNISAITSADYVISKGGGGNTPYEVSFTMGSGKDMSSNAGATKDPITITATDGSDNPNNWGGTTYVKLQAGGTIVVTPAAGAKIQSIVFTCTSTYEKTWSASVGSAPVVNTTAHTVTWTGETTRAVTLTNTASAQSRITTIVVSGTK